jgi:hypothetical protein
MPIAIAALRSNGVESSAALKQIAAQAIRACYSTLTSLMDSSCAV